VVGGRSTDGVLNRGDPAPEVVLELSAVATQVQAVVVSVQRDRVALRLYAPQELWPFAHLLADHEEGRHRAVPSEDLEHRRRPLRVRPVVEGDRDAGLGDGRCPGELSQRSWQTERGGEGWMDGS
jgi:hypothetical protein